MRQAQWELIIADTVTNATEASINITVDGDGNSFELTDLVLNFWLPQQDTEAKKADTGRIRFYYTDNNYDQAFIGSWTQAASAAAQGSFISIEQNSGLVKINLTTHSVNNSDMNTITRYSTSENGGAYILASRTYKKIEITKVTGKAGFRLYGKRKVTA